MELTVEDNYSMINCCVCGRIQRQPFPAAYGKNISYYMQMDTPQKEIKKYLHVKET
jgi:hypothetical protein